MVRLQQLGVLANHLRRDSIAMTTEAGSGHPSSCLSCAEIMSVLFFDVMRFDPKKPDALANDVFVLSKGHTAPILYAALKRTGCISHKLSGLRSLNSPLEGHPLPRSLPWIKVATGSLGQGLGVACGIALANAKQGFSSMCYTLLGDSEMAEGSVYEAMQFASYHELSNLVALVDVNRLGQTGQTQVGHHVSAYMRRFHSFGWDAHVVDGHDVAALKRALLDAQHSHKPTAIIAKTFKGKGVSFIENHDGWHGKVLTAEQKKLAFAELATPAAPKIAVKKPKAKANPRYKLVIPGAGIFNKPVATRKAFGVGLQRLAAVNKHVLAVDAEVGNSTFTKDVAALYPQQFIQSFIAEQQLVGTALGLSKQGMLPVAATFAAFLTRAYDQLRMAAYSEPHMIIAGSHCGVSIGEDGVSQMGLEDIAMMRALHDSVVLYPSDGISAQKLLFLAAQTKTLSYIRTTRPATNVLYDHDDDFVLGGFRALRSGRQVVLAGAGITVHEALVAHKILQAKGISSAVVDLYSIKPFDASSFLRFVHDHGSRVVVVEDHVRQGGIGEMVASHALGAGIQLAHLCVRGIPHSGKGSELLAAHHIDAKSIAYAASRLVK